MIIYQDFRYLGISWILFPGAFLCFISMVLINGGTGVLILNTGFNLGFLVIMSGFVFLYILAKERKLKNISKYVGSGDMLFLAITSVLLSPVNFIIFNLMSFMAILFIYCLLRAFRKVPRSIPLAGFQALFLLVIILFSGFISGFTLFNDTLTIQYILSLYG